MKFAYFLRKKINKKQSRKEFLKISQVLQENTCAGALNKVECWRPAIVFKKRLGHRCFYVNFANIL